ncbi:hypothetical protein [Faecalimonas sp.]
MAYTSFRIPQKLQELEKKLLERTKLSKATFHREAISWFLQGDKKIDIELLERYKRIGYNNVKEMTNIKEPVREKLEEVAKENNCSIGVVFTQALLDYCCAQAPLVLPEDIVIIKND